jgi:protein-S-isoprenylcysteine O-methyltransferase Ste14
VTVRSAATALRPYLPREWSLRGGLPRTAEGPSLDAARAAGAAGEFDLADALGKVVIVILFSLLAVRMGRDFLETARLTGLLLLTGELLVVALTMLRRPAMVVDRSWRARLLTGCSLVGPPLVAPLASGGLLSDAVTAIASGAGLLITIAGKLALGRSFGLMPANRGIVCTGLYRLVRHPIYAGWILLVFATPQMTMTRLVFAVVSCAYVVVGMEFEERSLRTTTRGAYERYMQQVPWKLVPGVY